MTDRMPGKMEGRHLDLSTSDTELSREQENTSQNRPGRSEQTHKQFHNPPTRSTSPVDHKKSKGNQSHLRQEGIQAIQDCAHRVQDLKFPPKTGLYIDSHHARSLLQEGPGLVDIDAANKRRSETGHPSTQPIEENDSLFDDGDGDDPNDADYEEVEDQDEDEDEEEDEEIADEEESSDVSEDNEADNERDQVVIGGFRMAAVFWLRQRGIDDNIHRLNSFAPMEQPAEIYTILKNHQLAAVPQLLYLEASPFEGGILGDEMGLGKTLTALALVNADLHRQCTPTLAVCLASTMLQWQKEAQYHFHTSSRMKVLVLKNPRTTITEILSNDLVICSYQYIQKQYAATAKYFEHMAQFKRHGGRPPKRPRLNVLSDVYVDLDLPFHRVIFDEVQYIKKTSRKTAIACRALHRSRTICLSGTIFHNRWHDVYGALSLLSGHPFENFVKFTNVFGSVSSVTKKAIQPTRSKIFRLQKFLLQLTIARPSTELDLPNLTSSDILFDLDPLSAGIVAEHMAKYYQIREGEEIDVVETYRGKKEEDRNQRLGFAQRALLASCHPYLDTAGDDLDMQDPADYQRWYDTIVEEDVAAKYPRVLELLTLYSTLRQQYPDELITIFSTFTRFLDIIASALEQQLGVTAVRFDGRVDREERPSRYEDFVKAKGSKPLLISAGTGGTGLNLQAASIVIQTEPFWNANDEKQVTARTYRQGQKNDVKRYRLIARNSQIDMEMLKISGRKRSTNDRLTRGIYRSHGTPVKIPPML